AEEYGQKSAWFYNNLAWLLSTAADGKVRNGPRADEAMKEALELMPNEPSLLDTEAAVCAELGRYEEAVQWETRFLASKSLTSEQRKRGEQRLRLYHGGQPYRQLPGE
ncbi:MAG: hypothetical protein ABIR29_01620, partial [Chthoniobacterales bacterium]